MRLLGFSVPTDKNFDFDVSQGAAVDITIDFDLSKSLVLEGQDYKLKPVLHIVETVGAATIEGFIANSEFPAEGSGYVVITVFDRTEQQQEYTTIQVFKDVKATDEMTAYRSSGLCRIKPILLKSTTTQDQTMMETHLMESKTTTMMMS